MATFTKSGCIACRDEHGHVTHKGKDGTPIALVIVDEAVPTVVGYTPIESNEVNCAWVLKKEHLSLDEVAGMLKRINEDKQMSDRARGKESTSFLFPMGVKSSCQAMYI
jgi:hypothetical protein